MASASRSRYSESAIPSTVSISNVNSGIRSTLASPDRESTLPSRFLCCRQRVESLSLDVLHLLVLACGHDQVALSLEPLDDFLELLVHEPGRVEEAGSGYVPDEL